MSTQSQRRANGIDLIRTLSNGAYDETRAAQAMVRRHGALGTFGLDHVLGNLWSRPQLSRRDRSLVVLGFLITIGAQEELEAHAQGALGHGLSRAEVEEVILQVAGYAGFPMAMQASRIVAGVWCELDGIERLPAREEAALLEDEHRWRNATDVLDTLFAGRAGADPEEARANIVASMGGVGELAFDFAFGELWSRDVLSRRDRSLATIAILAIQRCHDELKIHIRGALNHGVTRDEVEEVMVQLTVYRGFPSGVEGMRVAREIFARMDKKAQA
jgi:4-carboxymuconolactone decarboxylase